MTQDQIDALKLEIKAGIDGASSIAGAVAPEFLPYIVIGRAVAKVAADVGPDLVEDVKKLIQKAEPTEAEVADLAAKIHLLLNPETA